MGQVSLGKEPETMQSSLDLFFYCLTIDSLLAAPLERKSRSGFSGIEPCGSERWFML